MNLQCDLSTAERVVVAQALRYYIDCEHGNLLDHQGAYDAPHAEAEFDRLRLLGEVAGAFEQNTGN